MKINSDKASLIGIAISTAIGAGLQEWRHKKAIDKAAKQIRKEVYKPKKELEDKRK